MGKQVKNWAPPSEAVPIIASDTDPKVKQWTPPSEAMPVDQVKKKEPTSSDPPSEDGTKPPGSGVSQQPAVPPTEPTASPWEVLGDQIGAINPLGKAVFDAGRRIVSGFTDDIPKTVSTIQLKETPGNFYELFRPTKQFYKEAEDSELKPIISEYNKWTKENTDELTDGILFKTPKFSEEEMVKKFFQERHPDKLKPLEFKFTQKLIERRLDFEKDIQTQSKESAKKLGGAVQDFRDIKNLTDVASYIGTMGGQAAYQIPLAVLSRGSSSLLQESAAIYDQQIDNIARAKSITREEVIRQKLDDPAAGQAYAVLAAGLDALSAGNIIKAFRSAGGSLIKKWAKTAVPEAITEPTQGVLERQGAKTGSDTDAPAFDAAAMINEAAGGLIGGSAGVFGGKSSSEVIQEQKNAVDVNNPEAVKQAAETIQQKFNEETSTIQPEAVESSTATTGEVNVASDQSGSTVVDQTTPITETITDETVINPTERVPPSAEAATQNREGITAETQQQTDGEIQTQTQTQTQGRQEGLLGTPLQQAEQTTVQPAPLTPIEQDMANAYQSLSPQDHASEVDYKTQLIKDEEAKSDPNQRRIKNLKIAIGMHRKLSGNPALYEQNTAEQPQTTPEASGEISTTDTQSGQPVPPDAPQQQGTEIPEGTAVVDQPISSKETEVQPQQSTAEADAAINRPIPPAPSREEIIPVDQPRVESTDEGAVEPPKKVSRKSSSPVSGERATIVKLQEESKLSETLKEDIEEFKDYTVKKQSRSREKAQKYIKRVGEDQALQDAISFKWARPQEEKMALLSELADQFSTKFKTAEKAGDQAQVDQYYSKFMSSMNTLSNFITDTAQALSYLNLVGTVFETKTGALRFAKNQIEQSREGAMKNYQEMKMTAEQLIKEFDALPKEDFLKSKVVQDLIAKTQKESPNSQKSRQADKKVKDAADKLKALWNEQKNVGIAFDPKSQAEKDVKITKALIDYIKALIQKLAVDTGEKIQNVSRQVVDGVKAFSQEIGLTIEDPDVNDLVQDTIAREFERQYKGDIRSAVKEYVENKSGRDELIQKIIDTEGISQQQAADFTDRFINIFDEYLTKEKQKLVNRFTPKTRKPNKKRTEFYDKVIKLSNSGAVSDQQLDDAIANIFGLPEMTPQIATKIETMVEEINQAPEGRFKNIAITKLTDYIAQQQKFNVTDYMLASFRAGIFSGIDTQALNMMGNFFNVLEMGFMLSMVNPKAAARFIGSVRNPTSISRAGLEALEILRTGFDPRVAGDAKRRVLEQRGRTLFGLAPGLKGWKQALDPQLEQQKKYVFRALSAGDILFSQGINDALQNELYARSAKAQGLKGSEARAYVREKMGFTPEKIQAALDQANNEALTGQIPNDRTSISLRSKEIIEQQRDPNVIEKSREYAQEQILTNTPKGYIGIIARGLNSMIQQLPIISAVIPVVNFAANAMQRAVQYVPPAAMARGTAKYLSRMVQGENLSTIIRDDVNRLKSGDLEQEMRLRRFAAGTVSLTILAALLDEDEDGDNLLSQATGKTIKVHGSGPGTKLNRQKTYQKQETGYLPYSIQIGDVYIPYKNYPGLNVLMSTFGEYEDAKRYGKLDKKDALNRMVFAVANSFSVISEMGFLTSLNTTTQAFLEANPKEFTSLVTRPIGGILVPKFQRNLINFFDDQVYSGRDVQEIAIRSIPILNTAAGDPLLNALGEPVERNWWDRVELWNTESYTKHEPIWEENAKHDYYIPVPSKPALEETFERTISTAEYNKFFQLRGAEIVKNFVPELADLNKEEYARKMDKIAEFAKYKAFVAMGVMETDLMKEIRFQLDDLYEIKRQSQELKKQIKP